MQKNFTPFIYVYEQFPYLCRKQLIEFNKEPTDSLIEGKFEEYLNRLPEISEELLEKILERCKWQIE